MLYRYFYLSFCIWCVSLFGGTSTQVPEQLQPSAFRIFSKKQSVKIRILDTRFRKLPLCPNKVYFKMYLDNIRYMKSEPQEVEPLLEWTFKASDQFMQAFMLCGVMKIEYRQG